MCSEELKCQSDTWEVNHCAFYDIRPSMIGTSSGLKPNLAPYKVLLEKLADVPVDADFLLEGSCGI
jgi:hypothetical protein